MLATSIHAGAGNLSAYERTKMSLGRLYNRTKKAQGGTGANQHKQKGQIDLSATNTAAKLAAEHSALRLVEVPCLALQNRHQRVFVNRVALGPGNDKARPPRWEDGL